MLLRTLALSSVVWLPPLQARTAEPDSAGAQAGDAWRADILHAVTAQEACPETSDVTLVCMTVYRSRLLAALPELQAHHAVSADLTPADVEKRPLFSLNAMSLLMADWAVRERYAAEPALDASRWTVSLSHAGPDGVIETRQLFTFSFSRARNDELDWDKVGLVDFPEAAPEFSYNLRLTFDMSREMSGSIDDD